MSGISRLLIEDSTLNQLNEVLEKFYKGVNRRGKVQNLKVKIDAIHDLKDGATIDARLFRGNKPDQGLLLRIGCVFFQKQPSSLNDSF